MELNKTIVIKLPLDMKFWDGDYIEYEGNGYFKHRNGTMVMLENNDWEKQRWILIIRSNIKK